MWHTHHSGHKNQIKIFELSIARRVRCYIVFVDLQLPLLISGPINPCKYFQLACVISFKFHFFSNIHACVNFAGFSLRWSFCTNWTTISKFSQSSFIVEWLLARTAGACKCDALMFQHTVIGYAKYSLHTFFIKTNMFNFSLLLSCFCCSSVQLECFRQIAL